MRGAGGAFRPEQAESCRGRLGSSQRSARGRLLLPPAHGSSELHRRPPPWAPRLHGGGRGGGGTGAPRSGLRSRPRQARLLQPLAALGAGLPQRAEPEPPVPPPLLRPAPRAPPLAAPPLGPGVGSAPRGRSSRARHRQLSPPPHRALGPRSPRLSSPRAGAAGTATLGVLSAVAASRIAPRQGKATRPASWGGTAVRPVSTIKSRLSGRLRGLSEKVMYADRLAHSRHSIHYNRYTAGNGGCQSLMKQKGLNH